MIDYLKDAARCDTTGSVSSSRIISLAAGLTLSLSTVVLTFGSFWRPEMLSTLSAFGPSLAALAGANYVANRLTSGKKETTDAS